MLRWIYGRRMVIESFMKWNYFDSEDIEAIDENVRMKDNWSGMHMFNVDLLKPCFMYRKY